jgi:hypothetical protein
MPDRELPRFDVEAVGGAVRQPPLEDLYRVAARRRIRRRVSGVTVALVITLAAPSVASLASGSGAQWPGLEPFPSQPPSHTVSELFVFGERSAVGVESAENGCAISFGRTEDGVSWSDFEPMQYESACDRNPGGLRQPDIRYQPLSMRTYLASVDGRSYLSTDEGRTWQDAESSISVVDAFPSGAEPVDCLEPCPGLSRPLAVDKSGKVFRLRAEPSTHKLASLYQSPDGALWATYTPGDWGKSSMIARSADRGATWQTSMSPNQTSGADAPPLRMGGLAAVSGQVAYLIADQWRSDTPQAGDHVRLFRTSDGGRRWNEVDTDLPASSLIRPMTVGQNGVLLIVDSDQTSGYVWVSRDGGRHFTKGPAAGPGALGAMPGRAWIVDQGGAHLTSDGRTWNATLSLPE